MSEGHRTISWLFLDMETGEGSLKGVYEGQSHLKFGFVSGYSSIFNIALHSEWAKAWARMRRWSEEVLLIKEEMRHVLQYHEHQAIWWESKDGDHAVSASHADGIAAHCTDIWRGIRGEEEQLGGDGDEEMENEQVAGREDAPSDKEIEMAEGDNQEEGWEGVADDDIIS
jgi:hypothetical protein